MVPYRHHQADDVTGEVTSELTVQAALGQIRIRIEPTDPDLDSACHWLTPVAVAELVRALQATQRPQIPMPVIRPSIPMRP